MQCEIIASGSKGNCVVVNRNVMIDLGIPLKRVVDLQKDIRIVLLTHIHGDHFNRTSIRNFAFNHPTVRWGCGAWLVEPLRNCGVQKIDVLQAGKTYVYPIGEITPVELYHDVPNQGYKIRLPTGERLIYATDTGSMDGVQALNYDLYLIEANHTEGEIQMRIDEKTARGEYCYEKRARNTHLSKEKCDAWLEQNMGPDSENVYMHIHED